MLELAQRQGPALLLKCVTLSAIGSRPKPRTSHPTNPPPQVQNLNAMNCFLLFVKVFKYVAVIPQMNLLFATLSKAGLDLLFFSAVFVIVVTGFAMAFYMPFGLEVYRYRSAPASLSLIFYIVPPPPLSV